MLILKFLQRNQSESSQTYYEIRDIAFIKSRITAKAREPGLTRFAFIFGDYLLGVVTCGSIESAKDRAIKLSIQHGEPVRRVYKQNASMKWKRDKGLF